MENTSKNSTSLTMEEVILKTMVAEFAKELTKETTGLLKDLKGEAKHFFDDGVCQYLEKQKNKFSHVKTLLHRSIPVYFYDIYVPARLLVKSKIIDTSSINHVFWNSQCVTVIGEAGSGKSTLVKHLFLNSIAEKFMIPILIELRNLNDHAGTIEEYLRNKIFEGKLAPNERIMKRLLENGRFVFFLDGYDEIKSDSKKRVVDGLISFIDRYRANRFLLTSRPHSNIELMPRFHNHYIVKLNNGEIVDFVLKQGLDSEFSKKIIASITTDKVEYLKSYLTNPLLLSLYILTFSSNSSIPSKRYIFYRRVFDTLFREHDSISKIGFERELKSNLSQEAMEGVLKMFSFLTYFDGIYNFDHDFLNKMFDLIRARLKGVQFRNNEIVEDLKSAISIWTEDGGIVSFAHRSLQEYFAALYVEGIKENKGEVYKRIRGKLLENRGRIESAGFLSLCNEMDSYHYQKEMLLPSLIEIRSNLDFGDELRLLSSLLRCFHRGLGIGLSSEEDSELCSSTTLFGGGTCEHQRIVLIELVDKFDEIVFKAMYEDAFVEYMITANLHDDIAGEEDFLECDYVLSFANKFDGEWLNILATDYLLRSSNQFGMHITNLIDEGFRFVEETKNSEKELLDLL